MFDAERLFRWQGAWWPEHSAVWWPGHSQVSVPQIPGEDRAAGGVHHGTGRLGGRYVHLSMAWRCYFMFHIFVLLKRMTCHMGDGTGGMVNERACMGCITNRFWWIYTTLKFSVPKFANLGGKQHPTDSNFPCSPQISRVIFHSQSNQYVRNR